MSIPMNVRGTGIFKKKKKTTQEIDDQAVGVLANNWWDQ